MTRIKTFMMVIALVAAQGCGLDPLVYDDDGALRTSISLAEVEEASLPLCECLEEELPAWTVVPVREYGDHGVIVAYGQAVCTFQPTDGPTPEPSNPEGDTDADEGPTPEPSTPKGDRGLRLGPTPEPSNPEGSRLSTLGPTPEPSSWSGGFSFGPTPEPSGENKGHTTGPTPEPSLY